MSYLARSDKQNLLALAARLNEGLAQVEREIAENPAPPMRVVTYPLIVALVPYNELPETSVGALVAAAIRGELEDYGPRDVDFTFTPHATKQCMNCGMSKKAWTIEDGWCDDCSREP